MSDRREGRGQLSSIDRLPEEAEEDVVWALEQLRDRKLPQTAIWSEFNERLMDKGLDPISRSAFNRYSVKKAVQFRKLDEARKMAAELTSAFDPEDADQVTILIGQMIHMQAQNLLMDRDVNSKEMMEMARAIQAVTGAMAKSAEHRRKLQEEVEHRLRQAAAAMQEAGKKEGLDAATLAKITNLLTTGAA